MAECWSLKVGYSWWGITGVTSLLFLLQSGSDNRRASERAMLWLGAAKSAIGRESPEVFELFAGSPSTTARWLNQLRATAARAQFEPTSNGDQNPGFDGCLRIIVCALHALANWYYLTYGATLHYRILSLDSNMSLTADYKTYIYQTFYSNTAATVSIHTFSNTGSPVLLVLRYSIIIGYILGLSID